MKRARRRPANVVGLAAFALACAGCMRATAVDSAVTEGAKVKPWAHFFWFGTIGDKDVDVRFCEGPAARVQVYDDVLTLLTSFISLGIYTPRRVEVVCAAKTGARGGGT